MITSICDIYYYFQSLSNELISTSININDNNIIYDCFFVFYLCAECICISMFITVIPVLVYSHSLYNNIESFNSCVGVTGLH